MPRQKCFTAHNALLAGNPRLLARERLGYGYILASWASHGDHWRAVHRFHTMELFLLSRLATHAAGRCAEAATLVESLLHDAAAGPDASRGVVSHRPKRRANMRGAAWP
jgi:hypothetical protein